jgi:hypothetical protein
LFTWSSTSASTPNEPNHWLSTNPLVFEETSQKLRNLPPVLYGAQWVAAAAVTDHLEAVLTIQKPTDLYLALTADRLVPAGFEPSGLTLETDKGEPFNLVKARFTSGQRLESQSWNCPLVMAVPALDTPEERPLRPSLRYEAEAAQWSGVVDTGLVLLDKACVMVSKKGAFSLAWTVEPGLAGVYTLRFRYRNTTETVKTLRIQVVAADGRVMRDAPMVFPPASDKWRVISTTTGEAINAGHYTISLSGTDAVGFWLDSLDFQ